MSSNDHANDDDSPSPGADGLGPVVTVYCPHCQTGHPVREQVLGRLAKCTDCGQRFVLRRVDPPQPLTVPPPAPPKAKPVARAVPAANSVQSTAVPPLPVDDASPQPPPFAQPPSEPPRVELQPLEPQPAASTYSVVKPRPRASRVLAFWSRLLEAFAVITLAVGVLWAIVVMLIGAVQAPTAMGWFGYALTAGFVAAWTGLSALGLFLSAQTLRLAVHIEENTRQAAAASEATAAACQAALERRGESA